MHFLARTCFDSICCIITRHAQTELTTEPVGAGWLEKVMWNWRVQILSEWRDNSIYWSWSTVHLKVMSNIFFCSPSTPIGLEYWCEDLAGPWDWSAVTQDSPKLAIFAHPQRNLVGALATHSQTSRCVLHWRFLGETIERAAFVSTLRNGLSPLRVFICLGVLVSLTIRKDSTEIDPTNSTRCGDCGILFA